ncbi:hypothetical protein [Paraburkholderia bryophila]|uniref:Uncharacterized protein n=1 Tax=Paraburkholderia bryophila TaxID=420952 RepID=A0A7Y9W3E3_9BURK|nr:hypothetical protein [Paraburkholderia bryophila]NYH13556.1 hypothetical protein [Paraburkholderia bryophila]
MTFFELMAEYMHRMAVLNMTREQLDADPVATTKLLEIRDEINADPTNEITVGLRPRVERLLGHVDWKHEVKS